MYLQIGSGAVRMSDLEESLSQRLRAVFERAPAGSHIESFAEFKGILAGLEYFLSELLVEVRSDWDDGLDGFLIYSARALGDQAAELSGHCILIRDQTTTPFHLRLQLAHESDEISWLELRLGE